ncbi:MAG: hypothetical protein GXO11_08800 [Epsilonproteobacteria bacterium]|nr:hypothetical protein [Campylobacterota bacterium]
MFTKLKESIIIVSVVFSTALFSQSSVSLYFTGLSMDYSERADGKLLDTEESTFSDIYGYELSYAYTKRIRPNIYFGLDISYAYLSGDSDYTGSLLGSDDGYGSLKSITSNTIKDLYGRVYGIYVPNPYLNMKVALGYGKYEWERALSIKQVETYSWYPLGIELESIFRFSPHSPFQFGVNIGYSKGLSAKMDSSYPDAVLTLGGVTSIDLSFSMAYFITDNLSVDFIYEHNKQTIDKSDVVDTPIGSVYEPDSEDIQERIKFGMSYLF